VNWLEALREAGESEDAIPAGYISLEQVSGKWKLKRSAAARGLQNLIAKKLVERIKLRRRCASGSIRATSFYKLK
jgi:Fic family protein